MSAAMRNLSSGEIIPHDAPRPSIPHTRSGGREIGKGSESMRVFCGDRDRKKHKKGGDWKSPFAAKSREKKMQIPKDLSNQQRLSSSTGQHILHRGFFLVSSPHTHFLSVWLPGNSFLARFSSVSCVCSNGSFHSRSPCYSPLPSSPKWGQNSLSLFLRPKIEELIFPIKINVFHPSTSIQSRLTAEGERKVMGERKKDFEKFTLPSVQQIEKCDKSSLCF